MLPGHVTYLSPPPSGSGCFRPDIEIFMVHAPVMAIRVSDSCRLFKVCLSTDHACCFHTDERGRSPPSLETTCKWIIRMPLIYSQSQSVAVDVGSVFSYCVKCTVVAQVFNLIIMSKHKENISLLLLWLTLYPLFQCSLSQSVHPISLSLTHTHTHTHIFYQCKWTKMRQEI